MSITHSGAFDASAAADIIEATSAQFATTALSNFTASAGQLTGSHLNALQCTANGANAVTTRTASQLIADLQAEYGVPIVIDGSFTFVTRITNSGNSTVTLTAGAGVTITGTATIATGAWRDFAVTIGPGAAVTFQNIGGGTL